MWLTRPAPTYFLYCIVAIQIFFTKQEGQLSREDLTSNERQGSSFQLSPDETADQLKDLSRAKSGSELTHLLERSSAEAMITKIITLNRQGRNVEGYDKISADPVVKNALQAGNNTFARLYIHERLCLLGLMNCNASEERLPVNPVHRDSQDIIFAQPVSMKPIGGPLPHYEFNPIYLEPHSPSSISNFDTHPSYFDSSSSNFQGSYSNYKNPSISYFSKPVYELGLQSNGYGDKFLEKKEVTLAQPDSGIQQHVHHHYHHNGDSAKVISSSPFEGSTFNNYGYENGDHPLNDYEKYKNNFKTKTSKGNSFTSISSAPSHSKYANRFALYEKPKRALDFSKSSNKQDLDDVKRISLRPYDGFLNKYLGQNSYGAGDKFQLNNGFNPNGDFMLHKELAQSNGGLPETDYLDCVCVPYNRCAPLDQTGRKDDLYLAIDPRNVDKNTESDTHQVIVTDRNGTTSTIRVPKEAHEKDQVQRKIDDDEEDKALADKMSSLSEVKKEKRDVEKQLHGEEQKVDLQSRQFKRAPICGPQHVCCPRSQLYQGNNHHRKCGVRYSQGIAGRITTPTYNDGDSEFGEYPWQVAILKKQPGEKENVYVCGGSLISSRHVLTAAHCIKMHSGRDLRARLGEWDVNHDVEFFPYIERNVISVIVHPEFYAGTLYNDIAILTLDFDVDFEKNPHINPACLPDTFDDFVDTRCWTTGWGKDAFGDFGKYQNILKEVDIPVISNNACEYQMRKTRLGSSFNLHPGFICAGGEEGKDACKGDGGGPMVCKNHGKWKLAGIVSWGIGCGQAGLPGVYTRVSHYIEWIHQIIGN